jgi:membrane protease YdiL (CAAX protease family)
MSNLHVRLPWVVSFGCAFLFLVVALIGTPLGNQIELWARLPVNSGVLIQQILLAVFSAVAVMAFGGWRKAGFSKSVTLPHLLLTLPLLAPPVFLLFFSGIVVVDPLQIVLLVIFTALIGFAEEALCRGVMLGAFLPRGPLQAAVFSSLIFGAMHLIQLFYGMNIGMALLYVFYAALVGFGFAGVYLRLGGAIWPLILAHGLYDFLGKMGHGWGAQAQPTSSFEVVVRLAAALLIGGYSYWLLQSGGSHKRAVLKSAIEV